MPSMKTGLAAVSALAVAALLAGCSGDPEPAPTALPPLPPLPSPSPSSSPPSASPVPLPNEARAPTSQGAAAFARYYVNELGRAYASLDTTTVRSLSDPACKSCANFVTDIETIKRTKHRVVGDPFVVDFAVSPTSTARAATVDVNYSSPPQVEYDAQGKVVQRTPPAVRSPLVITLVRSDGSWRLRKIQLP